MAFMEEQNNLEFIYDDYKKDNCGDIDDFIFSVMQDTIQICEK